MIPESVRLWLVKNGWGEVRLTKPVSGGCINNGLRLLTEGGQWFFLKTNNHAPADMFAREAEGLKALIVPGAPKVPEVFNFGENFILLEDLAPSPKVAEYWEILGRQMAMLHTHTVERFGFSHDNYIGSTPQPNSWMEDGFQFFAEHRLIFQSELAYRRNLLSIQETNLVSQLTRRLPDLIPEQPASIIHGDLWSGNIISTKEGNPAIIDPAAYYGWGEADLAMMILFGSLPDRFFKAYQDVRPLEKGFQNRFLIYNLYHLLNHLNLFGSGYHAQVISGLKRFV